MSGYGYIRGDNNVNIPLIDITARNDIERLLERMKEFGSGIVIVQSSGGTSDVDKYLAHEIAIVDGKIVDTVTGEDFSESPLLEIDSTGQYIHCKSTSNAFYRFDALTDYTFEIIGTKEPLEDENGQVINLLYSGDSWNYSKLQVGSDGSIYYNSPQYTNYGIKDCTVGKYLNVYTERACTNEMYVAFSVSQENGTLIFNVQGENADFSDNLDTTKDFMRLNMIALASTDCNYFRRIRIYNKALSAGEMNTAFWASGIDMYGKTGDGITTLGPAVVYDRLLDGTPVMLDKVMKEPGVYTEGIYDYTIYDFEYPETELVTDGYTHCSIYTKINSLYVGDMAALSALPHPFVANQQYLIKWESSDNETVECINGLLFAHKAGTVTITATIAGTEISDSLEIAVEELPVFEENYYYPTVESYAFADSDPEVVMTAIETALEDAINGEYNGIVFPKMDYYTKPVITNATYKRCMLVMKDGFTIDFNGSTWYMQDNEYCHCEADAVDHSDGYNLFNIKFCEWVKIKNLKYYGERTYMDEVGRAENEYTEFTNFLMIGEGTRRFSLENVNFYNPAGFNISTKSGLFGTDHTYSQLHYDSFASGHITDDLTVEEDANCICTPDFIAITPYSSANLQSNKYRFGFFAYTSYHSITSRLYDCFFFDADYNLIKIDKLNHQYDLYEVPDNAAYIKVNFYQANVPTEDTPDQLGNEYAIAMFGFSGPDHCRITNCRFYNPHSSAISITGGQRFTIDHCYMENGKRYGWSVDFEDGWLEMRSNVIVKNICLGKWFMVMGNGNKFQNNFISALNLNRFNENTSVVNNHIRTWNQCERYSGVDAYNYVANVVDTEANSGTGWINQWNVWRRDESEQYGYTAY